MAMYYDREGKPMEMEDWAKALNDPSMHRVESTTLPNGKWVSTVWLGLDHNFGVGPRQIFESMVFPKEGEWNELDSRRYETLEEAKAGHAELVREHS